MTVNTETLLDKLYNFRGADSDILKEMDRQKNKAEETKARTTDEKAALQKNIAELKTLKEDLLFQGDKLKETLQGIHREEYETVLTRLHIDFDPKNLLDKLNRNLPRTIETVEKDTNKSSEALVKVEEEMNSAITAIEELGIRKDAALANQEKLNEFFESALSGNINITRDSITTLLKEFNFNEEEQREAAKILMFPEDALFQYDEKVKAKEKSGKSISEVIQEAKTKVLEEEPTIVITPEEEEIVSSIEDVVAEQVVDTKDVVINLLKENGIDYLDFSSDEIEDLIKNFNEGVVASNLAYIKSKGLDSDIYVNHISLMYDLELQNKIDLLVSVGKEVLDIYLNPNVLIKYSYEQLSSAIQSIQGNGMDPQEVPLMAY